MTDVGGSVIETVQSLPGSRHDSTGNGTGHPTNPNSPPLSLCQGYCWGVGGGGSVG